MNLVFIFVVSELSNFTSTLGCWSFTVSELLYIMFYLNDINILFEYFEL